MTKNKMYLRDFFEQATCESDANANCEIKARDCEKKKKQMNIIQGCSHAHELLVDNCSSAAVQFTLHVTDLAAY